MVHVSEDMLWMVVVGFIIAFILSFGIGANDVANAFGTSVGSKVLTLRQACILGSVFEILGAVLIGYRVSDTIRKGVIDVTAYTNGSEALLVVGNIATLSGSCVWLLVATCFKLPVSSTHSVIGALLGFSIVIQGTKGIRWMTIVKIVVSWVVSPLLSGIISALVFLLIRKFVLNKESPLENGLRLLPFFYAVTAAVNLFSIFHDGSRLLHLDKIPLYGVFILTIGLSVIVMIGIRLFLVPRLRKTINTEVLKNESNKDIDISKLVPKEHPCTEVVLHVTGKDSSQKTESGLDEKKIIELKEMQADDLTDNEKCDEEDTKDQPETAKLFSFLQILTAVFGSFAHGGNDVSNAIGPVISIWLIATEGSALQRAQTPIWILIYGGVGIVIGLWVLGKRVIETVGKDLTTITPSSGFCIEIGSAFAVLVASKIGIPVSTTHCKVGSVVFVGRVRSRSNVDWRLFKSIILAWIITLPISGAISAVIMLGLQFTV